MSSFQEGTRERGYKEVDCGLVPLRNNFLLPTAKFDDQKFEFYFLMDGSGSMSGERWSLATRALLVCLLILFLQSLPEDCYFNVIAFSCNYNCMFPQSVKYSQQTLEQARRTAQGMYIGGGTNIYSPLQYVYGQRQIPGYLTQIFSITDGHVRDRQSVLQLVSSKVKHSRSFSLGVGSGVDRVLVEGIAENAGGMSEFVTESEVIESKILHQLKTSLKPALLKPIRDASASRLIPMYEP